MKTTLVVARYNESLDWLDDVPESWRVVVYDKGDVAAGCPERVARIARPNIGREAETFAHHNATMTPAGFTAFVQGNPFEHWPDPIGHIERIIAREDRVGWLGFHYDTAWNEAPHRLEDLGFRDVYESLGLEGFCPTRITFPAGAQMVVAPWVIEARRPLWWYHAAAVAATKDWRVAHCFERLWPVIYRGGQ